MNDVAIKVPECPGCNGPKISELGANGAARFFRCGNGSHCNWFWGRHKSTNALLTVPKCRGVNIHQPEALALLEKEARRFEAEDLAEQEAARKRIEEFDRATLEEARAPRGWCCSGLKGCPLRGELQPEHRIRCAECGGDLSHGRLKDAAPTAKVRKA